MSHLVQCPACKNGVSNEAAACPHCGQSIKPKQSAVGMLAAIIIAGLIFYFAILPLIKSTF